MRMEQNENIKSVVEGGKKSMIDREHLALRNIKTLFKTRMLLV